MTLPFVPLHDIYGAELDVNLININYMETVMTEPDPSVTPVYKCTRLRFAGSDYLDVKESRDDIALVASKLHKGK